jgi:DNA-binding transcriptional ArsR family regulator
LNGVTDDDLVFKALADPTRRFLLDLLFDRDGRTLTELESGLEMTRFGVMKHLKVLEDAGLVVTRRSGREKLHFLNPVPIRLIHDRWIDKYTERHVSALVDLKSRLEQPLSPRTDEPPYRTDEAPGRTDEPQKKEERQ